MSLKKDATGRRFVQIETEVPGTPEEVWRAIATGPGISAWFVPTQVEEEVGGTITSNFGPGMESLATVTEWEPPHRFAATSGDLGPDKPPLATEWTVEARVGGTCVVRVVHSLFAETDDWDGQLESFEGGWPKFFRLLRLYLTHFPGQTCSAFRVMGVSAESASTAWAALAGPLGISGASVGEQRHSGEDAPPLAGTVEEAIEGEHHGVVLRLETPAPGILSSFALPMGGSVYLIVDFFLYGDSAAAAVAQQEPAWQGWMRTHFPFPPMPDPGGTP